MRADARYFVSCGASGKVAATSVDYARGWVNKPARLGQDFPVGQPFELQAAVCVV